MLNLKRSGVGEVAEATRGPPAHLSWLTPGRDGHHDEQGPQEMAGIRGPSPVTQCRRGHQSMHATSKPTLMSSMNTNPSGPPHSLRAGSGEVRARRIHQGPTIVACHYLGTILPPTATLQSRAKNKREAVAIK